MVDMSRRQFLRGDFSSKKTVVRPPWARAEAAFLAVCTRCCDCVNICPQHILLLDKDAWPTVDFSRGECTFCGECAAACQPKALEKREGVLPWQLKAKIQHNCLAHSNVVCRACGDACPVQAIRFSPTPMAAARPVVDNDLCTGCGACYTPCPVQAIRLA